MAISPAVQAALRGVQSGQVESTVGPLERWLTQHPSDLEAHRAMGFCMRMLRQRERSLYHFQAVQRGRPADPEATVNVANALMGLGRHGEARKILDASILSQPAFGPSYIGLSMLDLAADDAEAAVAQARRAVELAPGSFEAAAQLLTAMQQASRVEEAVDMARVFSRRWPGHPYFPSVVLWGLHYSDRCRPEEIFERITAYGRALAAVNPVDARPHANARDPERPLRVGYVSQDFRNRSAAHFIEPILAHHDRAKFVAFGYYHGDEVDEMTTRLREYAAGGWREIKTMSDRQVADLIRADGIDIMVDLTGHTGLNRLTPLCRRPAPVQMTYMGYPNTTGVPTIDYRIVDALTDPAGSERLASEKLVRMEGCFLCYAPPPHAPAVVAGPAAGRADGAVTFGCFNTLWKLSPATIGTWVRILEGVPNSRLLLKASALKDRGLAARYLAMFVERGIAAERVEMRGETKGKAEHMGTYGEVDIALDPFPYNGTTTTLEAIWMGVPVVTIEGDSHLSRVGLSLLTNLGFGEWVAKSVDEYVAVALRLAADGPRRAALRASLRATLGGSALCDGPAFTRRMEGMYREAWRGWCAGP